MCWMWGLDVGGDASLIHPLRPWAAVLCEQRVGTDGGRCAKMDAATKGAVGVIDRSIPPINPMDPLAAHMYVYNSIFFSYATETKEPPLPDVLGDQVRFQPPSAVTQSSIVRRRVMHAALGQRQLKSIAVSTLRAQRDRVWA